MKFSKRRILKEVRQIQNGEITASYSKVYEVWMDMAGEWFLEDSSEYLKAGFVGFFDRTPEEILADFHLSEKLTKPLSNEELENCLSSRKNRDLYISPENDVLVRFIYELHSCLTAVDIDNLVKRASTSGTFTNAGLVQFSQHVANRLRAPV